MAFGLEPFHPTGSTVLLIHQWLFAPGGRRWWQGSVNESSRAELMRHPRGTCATGPGAGLRGGDKPSLGS